MTDNDDLGTRAGVARMAEEQADETRRLGEGEAKEGEIVYVADINAPHLQQREVAQLTLVEKLTEMRDRRIADYGLIDGDMVASVGVDLANDIAALDAAIVVIEEASEASQATAPKPVVLA